MSEKKEDNKIDFLKDTVTEYLRLCGLEAKVEVSEEEIEARKLYRIALEGEELGILIGYHGDTLSSLQLFLNMAVYKEFGEWSQVLVDVGGYREEQEERLREIAQKVCERVRFENQPVEMRPMTAFERRIIHTAVTEMNDMKSESVGEGIDRRVVISLK